LRYITIYLYVSDSLDRNTVSEATDRYLLAMLKLSDGADDPTVTQVAHELRVAPSSVSQMVRRLAAAGLLDRVPAGLRLTGEGRSRAAFLVRRHRLSECFLANVLGIPWHRVHDEACTFERALGPAVLELLAERMGNPVVCPHGRPIPDGAGDCPEVATRSLVELVSGEDAVVAAVDDVDRDLLRHAEHVVVMATRTTPDSCDGAMTLPA
jgi:DtxR family Mn-dependent transcriptional regulator